MNAADLNAAIASRVPVGIPSGIYLASAYGAKCDGVTDDTTALQTAVTAIGAAGGGILQLPTGQTCMTSSTLHVGNGSTAQASSYNNVILSSATVAGINGTFGVNTASTLKYIGAGNAVEIDGPLQGWGLNGIAVVCNQSSGTTGLYVQSAQFGISRGDSINNCANGIYSTTVASIPPGLSNADSLHNTYENLFIGLPAVSGSAALTLTGHSAANTDYNHISNLTVACAGTTSKPVVLQAADSNILEDVHLVCQGGANQFVLDYSVVSAWPASNTLLHVDPAVLSGFSNVGSPGVSAAPNWLIALVATNGARYPSPALANLLTDHGPVPTSCSYLSTGALFNNSGTLALCP